MTGIRIKPNQKYILEKTYFALLERKKIIERQSFFNQINSYHSTHFRCKWNCWPNITVDNKKHKPWRNTSPYWYMCKLDNWISRLSLNRTKNIYPCPWITFKSSFETNDEDNILKYTNINREVLFQTVFLCVRAQSVKH